MKLDTTLEKHILEVREMNGGMQVIYKFPNNYGASLINHIGSYGSELAVVKFDSNGNSSIVYDTPITDDVLAYLNAEEAVQALYAIKDL